MGQILSLPQTVKNSEHSEDSYVSYGLSCMQGWRIDMEDAHATILDMLQVPEYDIDNDNDNDEDEDEQELAEIGKPNDYEHVSFFGVYDGHGGSKTAIFTGKYLHKIIKSTAAFKAKDYVNALKEGFLSCDQAILRDVEMRNDESGCAATSAIITPNKIYCGNAGDSRTVMSINGFAKALSYDHKPSNEGEKTRICSAGGFVEMNRVNGNLALSRVIGDFNFKKNIDLPPEEQVTTAYPDVISHDLDFTKDEFLILACDGIWDCLTSQSCVECVRRGIYERKLFTVICEEIMELCCAPTTDGSGIGCDNMSIVIVALLDYTKQETLEQWYDRIIEKIKITQQDANSLKFGMISSPYNEIYKGIFGEKFEIGQQAQLPRNSPEQGMLGGYSMFGGLSGLQNNATGYNEDSDDNKEQEVNGDNENSGAISLQKLLASNAITNENGVIYLDTSSAQSLLAQLGMTGPEDMNFENDDDDDDDDDDDNHQKHIEEDVEDHDEPESQQ